MKSPSVRSDVVVGGTGAQAHLYTPGVRGRRVRSHTHPQRHRHIVRQCADIAEINSQPGERRASGDVGGGGGGGAAAATRARFNDRRVYIGIHHTYKALDDDGRVLLARAILASRLFGGFRHGVRLFSSFWI